MIATEWKTFVHHITCPSKRCLVHQEAQRALDFFSPGNNNGCLSSSAALWIVIVYEKKQKKIQPMCSSSALTKSVHLGLFHQTQVLPTDNGIEQFHLLRLMYYNQNHLTHFSVTLKARKIFTSDHFQDNSVGR